MSLFIKRLAAAVALMFAAGILYSAPASAQATRTWISGVGDDVNPCSRTAPCKTFAGAISKTAAGGEIDCLDPGGFGAVTIVKSITLDCRDTNGSILVAGTNGITVNAANIVVTIRGISINGGPAGSNSLAGVRILQAASVRIENCWIFNFDNPSVGRGVSVDTTSSNVQLFINNTTISNNANGGVYVAPGSGFSAWVELNDVRMLNNGQAGVAVNTSFGAPQVTARIVDSEVDGGGVPGSIGVLIKAPSGDAQVSIKSSTIARNDQFGIRAAGGITRVSNSTIAANTTGVQVAAGQVISFGNNELAGNGADGAFSSTIPTN